MKKYRITITDNETGETLLDEIRRDLGEYSVECEAWTGMVDFGLMPCPFCGGPAKIEGEIRPGSYFLHPGHNYFVTCACCGIATPKITGQPDEAIKAWNRRVDNG